MANIFKRVTATNVTAVSTVHTVPAGEANIVIGMSVANVHTAQITVSVVVAGAHLVKDIPVPAGSTVQLLDGKIVLTGADTVTLEASGASDAILSYMQEVDS